MTGREAGGTRHEPRVGLVAGGGSGIGAACARRLARDGYTVIVGDIDESAARRVAEQAEDAGGVAFARLMDVSDPASLERVTAECTGEHGRLTVTVNSAGVLGPRELLADYPVDAFEEVVRVNLCGAFHVMRQSLRAMREGGGVLVNITSVAAGSRPFAQSVYAATKSAVISLTKSAAREYAPLGVRVLSVSPGPVRTPLTAALSERELTAAVPLGKMADPADVAALVAFLVSDEAWYITGSDHPVDGGLLAR